MKFRKKLGFFLDLGHRDHMYQVSSKSGSEPFRALSDLTWNDPLNFKKSQYIQGYMFFGGYIISSLSIFKV